MQCVILPDGVGTRLWPLREKSFRPILPLANVPFVHYQLSWLSGQGITEVVYGIAGPCSRVRAFAGDGRRHRAIVGVDVDVCVRGGTSGR